MKPTEWKINPEAEADFEKLFIDTESECEVI